MKQHFCACVVAGLLLCAGPAFAQAKARATTPEIPFDSVSFVSKMPAGLYMGEAIGVATNSKGNVFVIYKVSLDGKVAGKFGKAGRIPGEFGMANALDCRTENTVWVGEVWNWRAQRVTLKR